MAFFFPWLGGWRVWTHGVIIPIEYPAAEALEYFRHFVPRSGNVVMDVGGELGREAVQFCGLVGTKGHVYVYECLPNHLSRLRTIAATRSNMTVVDCACWDRDGEIELFVGCTPGSSTTIPDARGQRGQVLADFSKQSIRVRAETLNSLWNRLNGGGKVDFLKMDIEGAEYEALVGASEMLLHTRKVVIAAYHNRDGSPTASRVADLLKASGFEVTIGDNLHVYAERNES